MKSPVAPHALSNGNLGIVLFGIALCLFLLGNGRHSLWDRDEARFASASRQMLVSGDWVVPRLNDTNRYDKPILIYWLQAAAMKLAGPNETGARLPASIAGAFTVLMVYLLGLGLGAGRRGALLAAVMAMSAALLFVVSKASTTDSVLVATVVGMMLLYWEQQRRGFSWWRHVAFWVAMGLSALVKGPVGPLVVFFAIICEYIWNMVLGFKSTRAPCSAIPALRFLIYALRIGAGVLVFLAVCLPWAIAAQRATGGEFFKVAIGHHVIDRMSTPLEGHKGPFVYYIPVVLGGIFPWTAVALIGLRYAWRARALPQIRFLWCWFLPAFVVFSLVSTKLPHYVAPLLPAIALMSGLWFQCHTENMFGRGWWRAGAVLVSAIGIAAMGVLIWITWFLKYSTIAVPAIALAVAIGFGSCRGAWEWWRRRPSPALTVWAGTMLVVAVIAMLWLLPAFESTRPSRTLVEWVKKNAPPNTRLIAAEFREPSLVFYWGGEVMMPGNKRPEVVAQELTQPAPTALIAPLERWEKIESKIPPNASKPTVRFTGRYFIMHDAKWREMVIVGNW